MLDRPDAVTLLRAMAAALSDDVLPTTSGPARHAVRVVANLCRILEREWTAGPSASEQTRQALAQLLDHDATLPTLIAELDRALRDGDSGNEESSLSAGNASFDARAREVILADVERRLAIDQPGYAT
jgi:hypothetical protein